MEKSIADIRKEYSAHTLDEADLDRNPLEQFRAWFAQAVQAEGDEANAMTLATATPQGKPSARIVLLKGVDTGFLFFTNYDSHKGGELAANPNAALVLWWRELQRQVRIEGVVERISAEESDAYFARRPKGSKIGAWASYQSETLDGRAGLEERVKELKKRYSGDEIPRPPFWGGYRLVPTVIEFWQGRASRLHDRFRYRISESGAWEIDRLSP